jgi:ABC-type transport system involved in Fe-S cluster assembly fused permease/ATPase subunit
MDTRQQLIIIIILFNILPAGIMYTNMTGHYYYAFSLLGFFVLLIFYCVYLFFKDILSYEYDWTDKEIAKMNEDTENANDRK